jgi:hypothetical protein
MPVTPKIRSLSSEGSEDTRADYPIGRPIREPAFGDDRRRSWELSERFGIVTAWRTRSVERTMRCSVVSAAWNFGRPTRCNAASRARFGNGLVVGVY